MIKIDNLFNDNYLQIDSLGDLRVFEFYDNKTNIKKRQILIKMSDKQYVIGGGLMHWSSGNVNPTSKIKNVGDLIGKAFSNKLEFILKSKYSGKGVLALEPTCEHILLENVEDWGGIVLDNSRFLASESSVSQKIIDKTTILSLSGEGVLAIESPVAKKDLMIATLDNDEFKIDSNFVIAWSNSLSFACVKSTKRSSLICCERVVNEYKGTGKILIAPIC